MRPRTEITILDLTPAAMQSRREHASEKQALENQAFLRFLLILGLSLVAAVFIALRICR